MQVEVHIKNGRTVFRFPRRADFVRALANYREPGHEGRRIFAQFKHHVDNPDWDTASVRAINPTSVSFVLEVPREQRMTADALRAGVEETNNAN